MKPAVRVAPPRLVALLMTLAVTAIVLHGTPAAASNQLFKCVIDKRTVYQQQACPADAEPEEAKASAPTGKASDAAVAKAASVRPASRAASSEPARSR